jgi:hypothetical protein
MPQITEDEFWEHYSRGSGISIDDLRGMGVCAVLCDCGEPACRGWKMEMTAAVEAEVVRRVKRATMKWINRAQA